MDVLTFFSFLQDDNRNALMVASMIGNTDVGESLYTFPYTLSARCMLSNRLFFLTVLKLLEYHANPNLTDKHGTSALYESIKNNNEQITNILLKHGADLSMNESLAASTLCQTVFDADTSLLKRLLKAKIQVNACDYDKRTAVHIAASEGNIAAFKLLVEYGSDISCKDRWGNTAKSEAERANSCAILKYIDSLYSHC